MGFGKRCFDDFLNQFCGFSSSWLNFISFFVSGKTLLSSFQICCCGVIHKNLFKVINAFNLFPTCGYNVLSFLIFYITLFVFVSAMLHFLLKGQLYVLIASVLFVIVLSLCSLLILFVLLFFLNM